MEKKLKVLSLFDGMSCGQIALKKMGYTQDDYEYYASEIHQPSIKVTQHNFSNTIQLCVAKRYASINPNKANCLTARSDASWNCNYISREGIYYKLSCNEYEKLQTVPEGYTSIVKPKDRYNMLGNGWTVDVIVHVLKQLL